MGDDIKSDLSVLLKEYGKERLFEAFFGIEGSDKETGTFPVSRPYVNTCEAIDIADYPGDFEKENQLENECLWNAFMMVHLANQKNPGLGGHLSSYAAFSTAFEVGLNHFIKGKKINDHPGDRVYFQGHSSPGLYARAYLENRLDENNLENFRREAFGKSGLSSYPHPWLMPNFWTTPTVSMGLGPLNAIMQARFYKYLEGKGLLKGAKPYVWCFCGDGEMDEPESLAALSLAKRECLDNVTFIVSCNLQKLDGPVRGNGKMIQELESRFLGSGWHVEKCLWGPLWRKVFARDKENKILPILEKLKDGEFQKIAAKDEDYFKKLFSEECGDDYYEKTFGDFEDEDINKLKTDWGGHDRALLYTGMEKCRKSDGPSVLLAKTVKGHGLGSEYEARNIAHKAKTFSDEEKISAIAENLNIPFDKDKLFYRGPDSTAYAGQRRNKLGGPVPERRPEAPRLEFPEDLWEAFTKETEIEDKSTTKVFGKILRTLLKSDQGQRVVPIFPDEARTFGLETLFKEFELFRAQGQNYEPVDSGHLVAYEESEKGQLINEGISEAQAMGTFIAAGTSYESVDLPMVPFYIFYSQFGIQRVGDLFWAAGDSRCRGFLLGATSGRTTLNGEGLQHQDGHSPLWASTIPNLKSFDPAFGFELATIIKDGLKTMYEDQEDVFYYLNLYNENILQVPYSETHAKEEDILKGLYKVRGEDSSQAEIFASGSLMQEALKAHYILKEEFSIQASVWSVTSYGELYRDAKEIEDWNRRHPDEKEKASFLKEKIKASRGPIIAVTDYVTQLPHLIGSFIENDYLVLGTNGYGRSDTRENLRSFYEVDCHSIVWNTLIGLYKKGAISHGTLEKANKYKKK